MAPFLLRIKTTAAPTGSSALIWAMVLALVTAGLAIALSSHLPTTTVLMSGLILFGIVILVVVKPF